MDWSSLELKLTSCNDLKAFNFFQKLSAYAVVSIVTIINELPSKKKEEQEQPPQKKRLQRQKTAIEKGGRNPEWNHVFEFDLRSLPSEEIDHLFLKFDLRTDGLVHRTIGEVRVPLKCLIDEFCGVTRFVTYQVRDGDGKPNGVLNFSYKLKGKKKAELTSGNVSESSLPEKTQYCSSEKVVYPKVELDDDNHHHSWKQDIIRYPSLNDAYDIVVPQPVSQWQTPPAGIHHSRNSVLPKQVPVVHGGYFDPYSRSSTMVHPSATYWYTAESNFLR